MTAIVQTAFNTGRHYTRHGQRIAVRLLSHDHDTLAGVIALVDADRGIQGLYRVIGVDRIACLSREEVMRAYDNDARAIGFHMDYETKNALFKDLDDIAVALAPENT
jgi:hypothetical protein